MSLCVYIYIFDGFAFDFMANSRFRVYFIWRQHILQSYRCVSKGYIVNLLEF